jgi:hypothetical protein
VLNDTGWRNASGVEDGVNEAITGPISRNSPPDAPKFEFVAAVLFPGVLWKMEEPNRNVAILSDAIR